MKDSIVEVKLYDRPDGGPYVKVRLRSNSRMGVISYKDLDLDSVNSTKEMARAVGIAAGALAEYQLENYGDIHEPSQCAHAGVAAFEELWAELEAK